MATPSIRIEGISKRYRIGAVRHDYATLRDRIAGFFRARPRSAKHSEIWALRDINLEVGQGEALGLIGHNGAGKSTLLKILSRITEPTEGRVLLYGRVASLLEVGTGFHPELTGRENIFLNGAILGMSREEIRRNFDAIVAFAEIEQFIDTPVKRYSSGMYVRLAFAVAAHLTPEILLIDEVLAVGDIDFQRRCLGRMNEVARSGRTVVFVSHNLSAIESLCARSVLMSGGRIVEAGATREVISRYVSRKGEAMFDLRGVTEREGSGRARITRVEVMSHDASAAVDEIAMGVPFRVRIHYEASERLPGTAFGFGLLTDRNERVFLCESTDRSVRIDLEAGTGAVDCLVPAPNILPGMYRLEVWISEVPGVTWADHLRMVGALVVVPLQDESINVTALTTPSRGILWVDARWTVPRGSSGSSGSSEFLG
jgi:lipopolysaccharide transport system ATP-binding protein